MKSEETQKWADGLPLCLKYLMNTHAYLMSTPYKAS